MIELLHHKKCTIFPDLIALDRINVILLIALFSVYSFAIVYILFATQLRGHDNIAYRL